MAAMLGQMISAGFDLATLPARVAWRGARAVAMTPSRVRRLQRELRTASDEAARELRAVLGRVDADLSATAGHLSAEEKLQAASLALFAAEQHLSMAAVNLLRALWLGSRAVQESQGEGAGEQDRRHSRPGAPRSGAGAADWATVERVEP